MIEIEGLKPVRPPAEDMSPAIKELGSEAIKKHMRFSGPQRDLLLAESILLDIQRQCQLRADRGLNKDLTGVEDFKWALVRTTNDGRKPDFADGGDTLVFESRKTGKGADVDAAMPSGFDAGGRYHSSTATLMIALNAQ